MRAGKRAWALVLTVAGCVGAGRAQSLALPAPPEAVLSTRFVAPLGYEAALQRLARYYDDQVGRKLPVAFPLIAPHYHFEVWHDMLAFFEPSGERTTVTLKRPTAGITSRMVKSWMLDLAGRLDAAMPIEFKEEPPLHEVESDIDATRNDLPRALGPGTALQPVPTWEHAGMLVSPAPLTWVVLAPAGLRGGHHVTVAAESAAAARQLLARLVQGVLKPGIYAAYSEEVELNEEVHNRASGKSAAAGINSGQAVYIPNMDQKYLEEKLRTEPEFVKRAAAALGQYAIRFRTGQSYRKLTVGWRELSGYARDTGTHQGEVMLGQSTLPSPKAPAAGLITARTKLPPLKPGAYSVRLEGEDTAGNSVRIDERSFWFDGKTFEEL